MNTKSPLTLLQIVNHIIQAHPELTTEIARIFYNNKLQDIDKRISGSIKFQELLDIVSKIGLDNSFAGEYSALETIASKAGIKHGYCVDIGAGDGINQSSTHGFLIREGWTGLVIEMDSVDFGKLAYVYSDFPHILLSKSTVSPSNISTILKFYAVPHDFDILNVDIDSYDLDVVDSMLAANYKPKIMSMEINEKIPPPIYFSVNYDPAYSSAKDHFYGCSITAATKVVKPHGYILHSVVYNNAIFVRADIAYGLFTDADISLAYDVGYRSKPDRQQLFYWNKDVDSFLNYENPSLLIEAISNYFIKYSGKYKLFIS